MAISGNYAHPVNVNGYSCINCAEVALAQKDIDPANPSAGPGGANDPKKVAEKHFASEARDPAHLAILHAAQSGTSNPAATAYGGGIQAPGGLVSINA